MTPQATKKRLALQCKAVAAIKAEDECENVVIVLDRLLVQARAAYNAAREARAEARWALTAHIHKHAK